MSTSHAELKALLEAKLQELQERAERLDHRLSQPGEADSEENAALHQNDEVMESLGELTVEEIHDVRLAIDRINHGTYGVCTRCGKEIAPARLDALPFTMTCINCAR